MDGQTDGWNVSPFYRTLSPIGAAALPSPMKTKEPVAQRHQVVSDTLALLLFIGVDLPLGSRAAAPIGDEVL